MVVNGELVVIQGVSFLIAALINALPLLYLLGYALLAYMLVRHLRKRRAKQKRKNQ